MKKIIYVFAVIEPSCGKSFSGVASAGCFLIFEVVLQEKSNAVKRRIKEAFRMT